MREYMASNFANVYFKDCSVFTRYDKPTKKTFETNTGYVEFSSQAIRDRVFDEIEGNPAKFKFIFDGKEVTIKKTRSKSATDRNTALREATDAIKKHVGDADAVNVELKWDGRHVEFKKEIVFKQLAGHDLGTFVGSFEKFVSR